MLDKDIVDMFFDLTWVQKTTLCCTYATIPFHHGGRISAGSVLDKFRPLPLGGRGPALVWLSGDLIMAVMHRPTARSVYMYTWAWQGKA